MYISWKDWKKIRPKPNPNEETKDPRYELKLKVDAWTMMFNKAFYQACNDEQKGCRLTFKDHAVSETSKERYVFAKSICTRKGSECTMIYRFYIYKKPCKEEVVITVK